MRQYVCPACGAPNRTPDGKDPLPPDPNDELFTDGELLLLLLLLADGGEPVG